MLATVWVLCVTRERRNVRSQRKNPENHTGSFIPFVRLQTEFIPDNCICVQNTKM